MEGAIIYFFALALIASVSCSNSDPSQAPSICADEGSDGVLVAHKECNKFYKCSEGIPVPQNCYPGLQWNAEKEYCDWPENVNCESKSVVKVIQMAGVNNAGEKSNADPSEAPKICAAEGSDGILIAHENCGKFYKCSKGLPVTLNCYPGLQWNAEKEYCDWPDNVNCKSKVKETGSANPCASQTSGTLVPHEDCNKFYLCSQEVPVAFLCPENLQFDQEKDICNWPELVDCGERT